MKVFVFKGMKNIGGRVYPDGVSYVIVATSKTDAWKLFKRDFNDVQEDAWKVTELDTSKRSIIWL